MRASGGTCDLCITGSAVFLEKMQSLTQIKKGTLLKIKDFPGDSSHRHSAFLAISKPYLDVNNNHEIFVIDLLGETGILEKVPIDLCVIISD